MLKLSLNIFFEHLIYLQDILKKFNAKCLQQLLVCQNMRKNIAGNGNNNYWKVTSIYISLTSH